MNKTMKIISIVLLAMMVVSFGTTVLATTGTGTDYLSQVNPNYSPDATTTNKLNNILGLIKFLGIFLAVGILMFIGIKYMMGSAQEKAEYKKTMIPFVIGVVLLLAASTIIQIIQSTTNGLL
jgi:type IV secretory pathway VirB2 component (pilin)